MISIYIKTHNVTGLKYLGKTTKDPFKYRGSGKYWKRHLAKHGNNVTTEVIAEFLSTDECSAFALALSREWDIVNSDEWANLIEENGSDGAPVGHQGHIFTEEQRSRMSEASRKNWDDPEYRQRMVDTHKTRWLSINRSSIAANLSASWTAERKNEHSEYMRSFNSTPERKALISEIFKGVPKSDGHRDKIRKAHLGKPKTKSHKDNLSMEKILRHNPLCEFLDYGKFVAACKNLHSQGKSCSEISRQLNVGWGAVSKALKQ